MYCAISYWYALHKIYNLTKIIGIGDTPSSLLYDSVPGSNNAPEEQDCFEGFTRVGKLTAPSQEGVYAVSVTHELQYTGVDAMGLFKLKENKYIVGFIIAK